MKALTSPTSPTFDHPSDIIFAAISEVCYSRSIMPCAAFEDVPVRVRSNGGPGKGVLHPSHPTTIKLAMRTNARNKPGSNFEALDGDTLARCDRMTPDCRCLFPCADPPTRAGTPARQPARLAVRLLTHPFADSFAPQVVQRAETLDRRGSSHARELRVRYAAD